MPVKATVPLSSASMPDDLIDECKQNIDLKNILEQPTSDSADKVRYSLFLVSGLLIGIDAGLLKIIKSDVGGVEIEATKVSFCLIAIGIVLLADNVLDWWRVVQLRALAWTSLNAKLHRLEGAVKEAWNASISSDTYLSYSKAVISSVLARLSSRKLNFGADDRDVIENALGVEIKRRLLALKRDNIEDKLMAKYFEDSKTEFSEWMVRRLQNEKDVVSMIEIFRFEAKQNAEILKAVNGEDLNIKEMVKGRPEGYELAMEEVTEIHNRRYQEHGTAESWSDKWTLFERRRTELDRARKFERVEIFIKYHGPTLVFVLAVAMIIWG